MGFTKLFGAIVHSTIWREPNHVRLTWITMLAMADRRGHVLASLPGLADAARVTIEECTDALAVLSGPDPYSRTPDHEGRRIMTCDGGWLLLNYAKYRDLRSETDRKQQIADAAKRHRERKREQAEDAKNAAQPAGAPIAHPEDVRVVRAALRVLAPRMRSPEVAYIASWIAKADGDTWKLLAALVEVEPHLGKCKSWAYVSRICADRAQGGWQSLAALTTHELRREYVMHRLGGLI